LVFVTVIRVAVPCVAVQIGKKRIVPGVPTAGRSVRGARGAVVGFSPQHCARAASVLTTSKRAARTIVQA
jgi:hypothetical protein